MPNDITPPHPRERYENFKDPQIRKYSFRKWPEEMEPVVEDLIDEGFFCIDERDRRVQCVYCGGVFVDVKADDNVHIRHYRHFPKCARFNMREENFAALFTSGIQDEIRDITVPDSENLPSVESSTVDGINYSKDNKSLHPFFLVGKDKYPRHSYYALYKDRLRTFRNWPKEINQRPEELARAGLFYAGVEDVCECYCCGGQLEGWEPDDIPVKEHDAWFSDICPLYRTRH